MDRDDEEEAEFNGTNEGDVQSNVQVEPTEEELKKAELKEKALKLQEEIRVLKLELDEKVKELADVKDELGITTYDELKESLSYGWKVLGDKWKGLQETDKYKKADEKLNALKHKIEDSEKYQKTKETLHDWGGKAASALQKAGTAIKENETVQTVGSKVKSAGSRLKDTIVKAMSVDEADTSTEPEKTEAESQPITEEPKSNKEAELDENKEEKD